MKIVFLSRFQRKSQRGAETFVKELSSRLSSSHDVKIFDGKDADSVERVLAGKFDVVIPINGRMQSLKMSLARILGKYTLLISGHSGIGRDDIWNIAVVKPDVFVALTDQMAKWAKGWAWGSKVVKIPNGVDLTNFNPTGGKIDLKLQKPIILSVGALTWYKHHEKAINAVSKMDRGSLLIVGSGEKKAELEVMGQKLLGERFAIRNFDYQDMPKVYRSCDLFTLPSWDREAFGLVYLEAMASGVGVVAPNDESRREIVGDGGILTNVNDPIEYGRATEQALEIDWSRRSRAQAEKFSWDKIANEYERLMVGMLKRV